MANDHVFQSEAELVAAFWRTISGRRGQSEWTAYHETAGWDLLMVHQDGVQVGIEAKLSLNAKVLDQALPGRWSDDRGPDYRAVLVPQRELQAHLVSIALHLGITIIRVGSSSGFRTPTLWANPSGLPDEAWSYSLRDWPNWLPSERCQLPEYVPDVTGGHSAPVALTLWKIKAIKLLILLERNGAVTRADMKKLEISPTRWTDHFHGFLSPDQAKAGYIRNGRTPDLKAQHPKNWAEIEADFDKWSTGLSQPAVLARGAA